MRVGVFVVMAGRQAGGPETYEHCLVRQLVSIDRNNEYHIYCLSKAAAESFGSCGDNAKIHVLRPDCRWLSIPFSLPAQLLSHRIDLLHATFTPPPYSPIDYVFTMHSSVTFTHPEFYKPSILWRLNKLIMRGLDKARVIVCVSQHVRDEIAERFKLPPERLAVAYHGVNEAFHVVAPDEVRQTLSEKHNIRFPYALYVGKLQANKNMVRLIEAFALARKSLDPETKLVLVGRRDWSCDGMNEAISRLGLTEHVVEIGHLSHEDLPVVYSGARMFLFPSLWEGFGIPVIEAMACGTPVVTSALACLPEVAGGAALLVDPYSVEDIAGAIHKLGTDRATSLALREKGLKRAKQFSWENSARQTLEAYRRAGLTPT